jgi:hypothetical protein
MFQNLILLQKCSIVIDVLDILVKLACILIVLIRINKFFLVILSVNQSHSIKRMKEYSEVVIQILIITSLVRIWNKAMMYTIRFPIGLNISEDKLWSLLSLDKNFIWQKLNLKNKRFYYWIVGVINKNKKKTWFFS